MKRHAYRVIFGILILALALCSCGGGSEDNQVKKTAATATILAAENVNEVEATIRGSIGCGNDNTEYRFAYWADGGPVRYTAIRRTATDCVVSERIEGLYPDTPYHNQLDVRNSVKTEWTPSDIGDFRTSRGIPPQITGMTVGTPYGNSVDVQLTINPADPFTTAEGWLELTRDNVTFTATGRQTVPTGGPTTLTFTLTNLLPGKTYIYGRAGNSWGSDSGMWSGEVTITADNGTILLPLWPQDAFVIIKDGALFARIEGSSLISSVSLPPGKIQLGYITGSGWMNEKIFEIKDPSGNNAWNLNSNGFLDARGGISTNDANRTALFGITGSGFTPLIEVPANTDGQRNHWTRVTASTNNNVAFGRIDNDVVTFTQAAGASRVQLTLNGQVMNGIVFGRYVYISQFYIEDVWAIHFYLTLNYESDALMTGRQRMDWTQIIGGSSSAYVEGDVIDTPVTGILAPARAYIRSVTGSGSGNVWANPTR